MHTQADLLVLHQGAIGDFILSMSIVQALRESVRASHVIAIASSPSARLAAGHSAVDECVSPEDVGLHTLFARSTPIDVRLSERLAHAGVVLSFLGGPREPLHDRLCRATQARVVSVDPRPSDETLAARTHIAQQWAAGIRQQGLPLGEPAAPRIHLDENTPRLRSGLVEASPATKLATRILIHPGSGGKAKCWPIERFITLAESPAGAKIIWMLGPAELESAPERFARLMRRIQSTGEPLVTENRLPAAAERIAGCDLYIGNDAGMTHLAAALGVSTIAIFGPTDPQVWRPLGSHVRVAAAPLSGTIADVTVNKVLPLLHAATDSLRSPPELPR